MKKILATGWVWVVDKKPFMGNRFKEINVMLDYNQILNIHDASDLMKVRIVEVPNGKKKRKV